MNRSPRWTLITRLGRWQVSAINGEDGVTVICNLLALDSARAFCDRIMGIGPRETRVRRAARGIDGLDDTGDHGLDEGTAEGPPCRLLARESRPSGPRNRPGRAIVTPRRVA